MPCMDYRDEPSVIIRENTDKIDNLTQLLCGVMRQLDTRGIKLHFGKDVAGLKTWWKNHQEQDRRRIEAEQQAANEKRDRKRIRKQALNKLSDEERKALGLGDA